MSTSNTRPRVTLVSGPSGELQIFVVPCGTRLVSDIDIAFHRITCALCLAWAQQ